MVNPQDFTSKAPALHRVNAPYFKKPELGGNAHFGTAARGVRSPPTMCSGFQEQSKPAA
jgi:hypothetical protein